MIHYCLQFRRVQPNLLMSLRNPPTHAKTEQSGTKSKCLKRVLAQEANKIQHLNIPLLEYLSVGF